MSGGELTIHVMLPLRTVHVSDRSLTLSLIDTRGGRADRTGRYGNTHNDHNFRDMDYRGYGQEDDEAGTGYDVRAEGDRPYGHDEQSLGVRDFSPGRLHDHPGYHQRGDGRGDIGREGKGLLWPPCSQSQPDLALPMLQREEEGSRREFEQLRTVLPERGRGKGGRGFPENSAPHSGSRDSNWGLGGTHSEQMEFNAARQREEDRFSRGPVKRRVSHNKLSSCLLSCYIFILLLTSVAMLWLFCAGFSSGGRGAQLWECWSRLVPWGVGSEGPGLPCGSRPQPETKQHHNASHAATQCHCQWGKCSYVCLSLQWSDDGRVELLVGLNGINTSMFIDPGTTSGAGDSAKRGSPHEEQIFRWEFVHRPEFIFFSLLFLCVTLIHHQLFHFQCSSRWLSLIYSCPFINKRPPFFLSFCLSSYSDSGIGSWYKDLYLYTHTGFCLDSCFDSLVCWCLNSRLNPLQNIHARFKGESYPCLPLRQEFMHTAIGYKSSLHAFNFPPHRDALIVFTLSWCCLIHLEVRCVWVDVEQCSQPNSVSWEMSSGSRILFDCVCHSSYFWMWECWFIVSVAAASQLFERHPYHPEKLVSF